MAAVTALALGLLGLIILLNVHASVPLNCAASPHVCGFPDATNTGFSPTAHLLSVPSQVTSGPGWKYDTRGWVEVSGKGASLSGLYIPYNLDISASNVTINNVEVVETGNNPGISLRHTSNVTIENSDISSPYNTGPNRLQVAIKDIFGDSTGTTINANNIWNTSTAVQISEGTVENNYIHNLGYLHRRSHRRHRQPRRRSRPDHRPQHRPQLPQPDLCHRPVRGLRSPVQRHDHRQPPRRRRLRRVRRRQPRPARRPPTSSSPTTGSRPCTTRTAVTTARTRPLPPPERTATSGPATSGTTPASQSTNDPHHARAEPPAIRQGAQRGIK